MSKVVERRVCQQLVRFLEKHKMLPKRQSAYRRYHSTETSVLKIVSDALSATEKGKGPLRGMLDMSAAFDTVDDDIFSKDFICRSTSAERLYHESAPSSAKGRKLSLLTAKCQKRRW